MTLLLLFVVIVAIAFVVSHELRVIDRANHSSDDLAERQRRVRIETDR
jgi:hypothetical protein